MNLKPASSRRVLVLFKTALRWGRNGMYSGIRAALQGSAMFIAQRSPEN
jgi:hypothetical protein